MQFVEGARDALRRGRARLRRGRPEAGAPGLRGRRPRRRDGRDVALHQPSASRRRRGVQRGALRGSPPQGYGARGAATASVSTAPARAARPRRRPGARRAAQPPARRRAAHAPRADARVLPPPPARPEVRSTATSPAGLVVISGTGLGLPGADSAVMDPTNVDGSCAASSSSGVPQAPRGDGRGARHAAGEGRGRLRTLRAVRRPEGRHQARRARGRVRSRGGVRRAREARRGARHPRPSSRWRRGSTRCAKPVSRWCRPTRDHDRQVSARPLDAAGGVCATRRASSSRRAFPGDDRSPTRRTRYYTYESRAGAQWHAGGAPATRGSRGDAAREITPADRRVDLLLEQEPYAFRPALHPPDSHDGPQPVRRVHRRARPEHPVNAACASTAPGVALAEDWIRGSLPPRGRRGRRRRHQRPPDRVDRRWFLRDGRGRDRRRVEDAALPLTDAATARSSAWAPALVVEAQDAVEERGMRADRASAGAETATAPFTRTRLDVDHIAA